MAGEKILDIDDSPTVRRLTEMILNSQGYEVILASDGEEGIAKARSERPAVILVDFVMPKMNGFQVCKNLKEDPDFKDTPIILVTSKGDKVGSKFVDTLGITDFFTKPFQPEELLAKIREVIDKRKDAELPQPTPARKPAREGRTAAPAPLPGIPAPAAGMEALVRSVVETVFDEFIKNNLPDIIQQELAKALHAEDTGGIKGNLTNVRIAEVLKMLGVQRRTGRVVINRAGESVVVYFKDGAVVFASMNCEAGTTPVEDLLRTSCRINGDSLRHVMSIAEMTSQPIDRVLVREKVLDQKTFSECLTRHVESAVYKVMTWREGDYSFEKAGSPAFAFPIRIKVDDLLREGQRRTDEWDLIRQKIPEFNLVFESMTGNAVEPAARGLGEVDRNVFSLINGKRTVQDIIEKLNVDEFDVARSIFILITLDLIRRKR
jgi:CheY-like chemotaxis protein